MTFTLRPYTATDAPVVVALVNTAAAQTLGVRRAVVDAVGNVRLAHYVPPTCEKVVAADTQGQVIGYAYLTSSEQGVINTTGGAVHPAWWGQGVGAQLVEWAEARALVWAQQAPVGVKALLQANLYEAEEDARQLFSGQGFVQAREWAHLVIDLAAPPPLPLALLAPGLVIRAMDLENDWEIVGPAMDDAFADHWGAITWPVPIEEAAADDPPTAAAAAEEEPPTDDSFSNTPGFCFIALDGATVAGGVLCNAKLVERADTGRVGSLFVRPAYRRQGVGRALMLTAFQAFWQAGLHRIINDTDAESFTAAPRFYQSLGMQPYRREFLYEKEVRPGKDVRRLA